MQEEGAGLNINAAFRPEQPAEHGRLTAPTVQRRVEPEARAAPSSATWRCHCMDEDRAPALNPRLQRRDLLSGTMKTIRVPVRVLNPKFSHFIVG